MEDNTLTLKHFFAHQTYCFDCAIQGKTPYMWNDLNLDTQKKYLELSHSFGFLEKHENSNDLTNKAKIENLCCKFAEAEGKSYVSRNKQITTLLFEF
jgi:hypothetical protein